MRNKRAESAAQLVSYMFDGATVLVGGFGHAGIPDLLIDAVCERGLRDLTIVTNNSGRGRTGIARLVESGCVAKMVCSFPIAKEGYIFREWYEAGKIAVEVVPQGTLAERIRCAGAGLGGFLTPTGVGTEIAEGKQVLKVGQAEYVLELPLRGDFALIRADAVDPRGNLTYRKAARNFNAVMVTAAETVLVQGNREVPLGALDPEAIITPGLYVDHYFVPNVAAAAKAA
jgi:3-oxoadipate CoA-transferase, alpha subunit